MSLMSIRSLNWLATEVDNRGLNFISAFWGGRESVSSESNIALAIVDVIMETDTSGLELVDYAEN